jgi:hypothetical protein
MAISWRAINALADAAKPRALKFSFIPAAIPVIAVLVALVQTASAQIGQGPEAAEAVTVTAERRDLVGLALTSSQGVVVNDELALTPAFRAGQLLETVPGLIVTSHSGEGKANQFLLRGFSLDHGTDLAVSVDGMPVNERTHAHGQGYSDLNFMVSELATGIHFTKGPYFAEKGDFAAVGSVDIEYLDTVDPQFRATVGSDNFERLFAAGSLPLWAGNLLAALEAQHFDGPWEAGDNQRKLNAVLRYSAGEPDNGYSLAAMYYGSVWNATTDQPLRALTLGLIGRFGSLDPSDGGSAQRISLSGQFRATLGQGVLQGNAYAINNRLTLWNDFTHFLNDPIQGDQEVQTEARRTFGGGVKYSRSDRLLGFGTDLLGGVQLRYDGNHVLRDFTRQRMVLGPAEEDWVEETSLGTYAQAVIQWTDWLRTVVGAREDYFIARDRGTNAGQAHQDMFQPKASLVFTLSPKTEFYLSAGRGFHSDDVRGTTQAAAQDVVGAPLIARATGEEVGIRHEFMPNLSATLTAFQITFQSELTYDPDAGITSAGPPSRRQGVELNTTWQALEWLEFYTSFAASNARYTEVADDGSGGHQGRYIPNAPNMIASIAAYIKHQGPWDGGVEYRYLGGFPLTPDNQIRGRGFGELNGEIGYTIDNGWKFGLGLYNILNEHSDAAQYWYRDRLPGEPAGGLNDVHVHPLEPLSLRISLGKSF